MPQVTGRVADYGRKSPAVGPLLLPPKHGQLFLRKMPEVRHHILPYGIRGRPLQAATQPVRQVLLLVAASSNSSLSVRSIEEQWQSVRPSAAAGAQLPLRRSLMHSSATSCKSVPSPVRQLNSEAVSIRQQPDNLCEAAAAGDADGTPRRIRQQHSSQAISVADCVWLGAQLPSRPQSGRCSRSGCCLVWSVYCMTDAGAAPLSTPARPMQVWRIALLCAGSWPHFDKQREALKHAWAVTMYHTRCSTLCVQERHAANSHPKAGRRT